MAAKCWPYWIFYIVNAHLQPILMIFVSKFMVHRALSDKTYLSLGLLSPLITELHTLEETRCLKNWCLSRQITFSTDAVDDSLGPSSNQGRPKPGTSAAQGCLLRPPKLYRTNPRMCHQHGHESWVGVYSIDGTQTDSLCYSESSMVWLTSLPTTFNPTTPVREVPNACGSYKILKMSTSTLTVFPCTIIDWNRLPTIVTDVQTLQEFREGLSSLPPQLLQPY